MIIKIKGKEEPKEITYALELEQSGGSVELYCTTTNVPDTLEGSEKFKWSLGTFKEDMGKLKFIRSSGLNSKIFQTGESNRLA